MSKRDETELATSTTSRRTRGKYLDQYRESTNVVLDPYVPNVSDLRVREHRLKLPRATAIRTAPPSAAIANVGSTTQASGLDPHRYRYPGWRKRDDAGAARRPSPGSATPGSTSGTTRRVKASSSETGTAWEGPAAMSSGPSPGLISIHTAAMT
jgi:hypothetical protein